MCETLFKHLYEELRVIHRNLLKDSVSRRNDPGTTEQREFEEIRDNFNKNPSSEDIRKQVKQYVEAILKYFELINQILDDRIKECKLDRQALELGTHSETDIQDSRSTSSLSESLRDLEYICKQNNIPELIVIKKNQNAFYPNRFCINKNFLNEIIKIGKQLKTRNLKISILKDIEHITDKDTQQLIINDFHMLPTGGHAGINRTYNNIKRYYFWNGLQKDVQNFIRKCDDCQRYKHSNAKIEPMEITTTATSAYQKVYLDLIGPLEPDEKNHKYILTLQCELSKFVEAYPLINKEANTVAEAFVQNFILRYGVPDEIVTDKGTEFLNSTLTEVCKILKIKKTKFNSIPPPNFRLFGKFS
ncbi:hypothetical protein PPYR_10696 [Photinus pyralis]|uniref:RNA-directed DNA polymerase n=1 Tax=Photinus pyralis TaxID=7054 RepID=A0A5N4AH16_PHOPY|nr:hypothetical protein PPYR_10696 [Photinus pyralis]